MSDNNQRSLIVDERAKTGRRRVVKCTQCSAELGKGGNYIEFVKEHVAKCGPAFDRARRKEGQ